MRRFSRIYLHTMMGALGGWFGWMLFSEWCSPSWSWHVLALTGGLLIGACIGLGLAVVEALADRSLVRLVRRGAVGIVLGGLGGAIGCWLGEWINYIIVSNTGAGSTLAIAGSVLARMLGWAFFGCTVGMSEGIALMSRRKIIYGVIGGSLGGALGGLFFGILLATYQPGETSYIWGQALGLVLLGALIGMLRSLVEEVMKPAALRVLQGWHEGREYAIVNERTVLGRDEAVDILLLRDMAVMKRHALLRRDGQRYWLQRLDGPSQDTRVNDQLVNDQLELQNGDRIQLGATVVRFQQKSAK
ncbi:MAG: FHA domain-containing protein [Planctomycetia bacterium]|nr:FHA domain-containing protein [Planctomycetia bacterium]